MSHVNADLVVIGGGMAGLPIANKAAYKGKKTVLIEQELLGGTCLNRGCIPTKTMIHAAKVAHVVRTARRFGILTGEPKVDLAAIVARKDQVLEKIRRGAYRQVEQNGHLELIEAHAVFESPHRLRAGDKMVEADQVIINTGARPVIPPIEGLDQVPYHTSRTLLDVTELPDALIVIGGGYVGCEFAQMFARFGAKVTIVQRAGRLLSREDPEVIAVLLEVFRSEGIEVLLQSDVQRVAATDHGVRIEAIVENEPRHVEGAAMLIATGRTPNADDLGLDRADVEIDERGFIRVDTAFRTSQSHIWAIGDVVGGPMFTHSARDDANLLYQQLFKGRDTTIQGRIVPYAIFTDPEIAAVGLSEAEARRAGFSLKLGRHAFARVARAQAMGETDGFVKLVADAETDRLLGAQIIGPHAGELIHELVVAMQVEATYEQIARSLHIHPTLAEGVNAAAGGVHRPAGDT